MFDGQEMGKRRYSGLKAWFFMAVLAAASLNVGAQNEDEAKYVMSIDRRTVVEKLSFADRLALRTNGVDWALLIPNVGIEFDLGNKNWNRWSVGVNFRDRWQSTHTYKPFFVYNLMEVRLDLRNYWRPRQISDRLPRHTSFIDRLFSRRRSRVKHPLLAFYRGLYFSFSDFSLKVKNTGHQGRMMAAGITYGFVKPLYVFKSGNSLDFDMGLSIGAAYAKIDKFTHNKENDCYPVTEEGKWKLLHYPVPTELRLGFIYRVGKYPVTRKYRWRYDADAAYTERIDSIRQQRDTERRDKLVDDSISNLIYKEYWHEYDSITKANASTTRHKKGKKK